MGGGGPAAGGAKLMGGEGSPTVPVGSRGEGGTTGATCLYCRSRGTGEHVCNLKQRGDVGCMSYHYYSY